MDDKVEREKGTNRGWSREVKEQRENKRWSGGGKGSRRPSGKEGRDKEKINSGAEDEKQRG